MLAILYPDAHQRASDNHTISYLARLAQDFKDQH
ncbi:hypothetical protein [Halomonas kashgarensis]